MMYRKVRVLRLVLVLVSCVDVIESQVNGGFSQWSAWSELPAGCTVSCGGGSSTFTRYRSCNNPPPSFGGRNCSGNFKENKTELCKRNACPTWIELPAGCAVSCGGGNSTFTRYRSCDNPPPSFGGRPCSGNSEEKQTELCNRNACPNCPGTYTAYIVVDGSASISPDNFLFVKSALKDFASRSISRNNAVRIGLVVYSDSVTDVISASSDVNWLKSQIAAITQPEAGTATHLGIETARLLLTEDSSSYTKVMIVITDGLSAQPERTKQAATQAKQSGIIIVAVGIDEGVKMFNLTYKRYLDELLSIVSSRELVFHADTFKGLVVNEVTPMITNLCRSPVFITRQLQSITVLRGNSPSLTTVLSLANITSGIWAREGTDLAKEVRYQLYDISIEANTQTLRIINVQLSQSGQFSYTVGSTTTSGTLTVVDRVGDVSTTVGQTATFRTSVSPSTPGFWSKNGTPLPRHTKYIISESGETRMLEIKGVQMSDSDQYGFTVNNLTISGTLTVTETNAIDTKVIIGTISGVAVICLIVLAIYCFRKKRLNRQSETIPKVGIANPTYAQTDQANIYGYEGMSHTRGENVEEHKYTELETRNHGHPSASGDPGYTEPVVGNHNGNAETSNGRARTGDVPDYLELVESNNDEYEELGPVSQSDVSVTIP